MRALKPKRVLLVDDHQVFLKVATSFLRDLPGVELVGQTTSGDQAVELAAALHPDLVLMDFAMPGMNGLEAMRRIKLQPNGPKVVILTLHINPGFRAAANGAGADGFLLKEDLVVELPRLLAALFPVGGPPGQGLAGLG